MANIPITTIVKWCVMSTTTTRNRIFADMMSTPEGLKHLNGETSKEMLGIFWDYDRRDKEDKRIKIKQSPTKEVDKNHVLG